MGNQNKGIFIVVEIAFQPFNMLFIQIVGRLVQKKNVRLFQQKFSEKDFGPLTSGKLSDVPFQTDFSQTEGTADFFNFGINLIKVVLFEQILDRSGF